VALKSTVVTQPGVGSAQGVPGAGRRACGPTAATVAKMLCALASTLGFSDRLLEPGGQLRHGVLSAQQLSFAGCCTWDTEISVWPRIFYGGGRPGF